MMPYDRIRPWLDTASVPLHPGECIGSFAIRLAPLGLVTVDELVQRGLGLLTNQLPLLPEKDEAIRRLAIIGGLPFNDLKGACWQRTERGMSMFGREMPENWIVKNRRRLAPARLAKDGADPWIRMLWQVRGFPCDPESGELLRDTCECGIGFGWNNAKSVCVCSCGRDVREQASKFAPPEIFAAVKELAEFIQMGRRPSLPKPFDELSDFAIFSAATWFGYFAALEKWLKPSPIYGMDGYEALQQWPQSFDAVVSELAHAADNRTLFMSQLTLCIQRVKNPDVELILRERASQLLGLPSAVIGPVDTRKGAYLLRDPKSLNLKWDHDGELSEFIHSPTARRARRSI